MVPKKTAFSMERNAVKSTATVGFRGCWCNMCTKVTTRVFTARKVECRSPTRSRHVIFDLIATFDGPKNV